MTNTPFLQQVAGHYYDARDLEDYCFVFPNRRSGQFFAHYLQRAIVGQQGGRPRLMPCVTSISEFVSSLTGTVTATDIEQMFALYDAYCRAMGDQAQEFDKFIYWAQLIISDFNDIDRSLADAGEIYRNLADLHDLSSNYLSPQVKEKMKKIFGGDLFTAFFDTSADADLWRMLGREQHEGDEGEVKREFLSLWNALATIFATFHDTLAAAGVTTAGKQLRMAAEGQIRELQYARVVFVGFGVLSAAEVKLFDRFKAADQADYWWDNAGIQPMLELTPPDPGALLIDGYCKRFGAQALEPLTPVEQQLRVVSVPSTVGQAKQAFDEVVRMMGPKPWRQSPGIETAIVLPDEGLLVPLLHSVHDVGDLNVTLGYPLRSSGIVSLMHIVARMHHQTSLERGVWTYYREDIYDILSHPLIKTYFTAQAMAMTTELARTNRFRVPASEFQALSFGDLFTPAVEARGDADPREEHSGYIDHLLSFCNKLMDKMMHDNAIGGDEEQDDESSAGSNGIAMSLQQAFLDSYIDVLTQLKHSLVECGQTIQLSTVFFLIDRLTAAAVVPFTGEPLRGLQVMGLLETRSLDFERVVILSMNERVFPRRRSINSFIPNYIRRAMGMSTIEQQEAIVAFNFYRLLNRASQVTLVSDSSAQKMGSSEPSRYISQLEKVYGRPIQFIELSSEVETSSAINIQVPNGDGLDLQAVYTASPEAAGGKYLSASAINKFINCPLMFYMHYVQGLSDDNEVSDFMDYGTFGTIIHDTLSDCYDCQAVRDRGGLIDKGYLQLYKSRQLKDAVERNIRKTYLHVPDDELDNGHQPPLRGEAYMLVDTIKSYVEFVLDYDIVKIDAQGPFKVLECETTHNMTPLVMGDVSFNFTYKPDRIDQLADGTVRIVDYKTGKDETAFTDTPELDDLFDSAKSDRRKAVLQLFLYSYAYLTEHREVKSVMPVIYKLASMKDSGVKSRASTRGAKPSQCVFSIDTDLARNFVARMAATIDALYHIDFIQAPDGSRSCNYCRFIDMCRRSPIKSSS